MASASDQIASACLIGPFIHQHGKGAQQGRAGPGVTRPEPAQAWRVARTEIATSWLMVDALTHNHRVPAEFRR
jgi:hypothetical protein